jgi:hypothetical protein
VKEEIGSKLTAIAGGRFFEGPWPAANAGGSISPPAAITATAPASFDARILSTSVKNPCSSASRYS